MLLYALTIFASAFLLFLVQPIIAKEILPWFGGSAAVWTTCLVFFQSTLLAGYAYADVAVRRLSRRRQAWLHSTLLVGSLLLLPVVPGLVWKPLGTESPLWLILGLLAATIGLPYLLLSTTSPLLQAWFAQRHPGRNPYRLFALSNFASMLALLAYPFAIEPWIPTHTQAIAWSAGYAAFAALCIATAFSKSGTHHVFSGSAQAGPGAKTGTDHVLKTWSVPVLAAPLGIGRHVLWASLAAMGSILLLSVTSHITENIAAVPLLWIVPLSIYLITFILCFEGSRWYPRGLVLPLAAFALGGMAWAIADPSITHALGLQLSISCGGLFVACMFCHGELARLRPAPQFLTRFYLMVSLGGALGAVLIGIVVPVVLPANFDLALGLVACAALLTWQVRRDPPGFAALAIVAAATTVGCAIWGIDEFYDATIVTARNFYGVLRVQAIGTDSTRHRSLIHGTILHGTQYLAPQLRRRPTTYYTETSGVGRVLESLNPRTKPLRVGVIGLGTGTLAAYGAKGDVYRFYDINPAVIRIARTEFTYLADSDARIETVLGDARLSLEREPPQQFDLLAIDAFSSDAIPVHLITSEALALYMRHVKPDGVIAFHVTNRYLDLVPVVAALAHAHRMQSVWIPDEGDDPLASRSDWVLVSNNTALLANPRIAEAAKPIEAHPGWRLWTDDFNNLFQVLR
ncbi:MAG: fused MFS/spermidine synthase, partial [Betaproteobacteria bacterium]|nr:fused MFS/spermidine synthase [Betaproteobacteria bacterium]